MPLRRITAAALLACLGLLSCTSGPKQPRARPRCAEYDPLRKAYFGDLHVHTSYSNDAWTYETRATPADAYAFARGQPVRQPPLDANGEGTTFARLERPLDFAAVTDHSEYLGETSLCTTPGSISYDSQTCAAYRPPTGFYNAFGIGTAIGGRALDLCGSDGEYCAEAAAPVWQRIQQAAADAYDDAPRCAFTSFVGYEYTLAPLGSNMHRNVIFRSDRVPPAPISFYEAPIPRDLWQQLKAQCIDAGVGCDAISIPHNSNISNGNMFLVEYPGATGVEEQRAQASLRASVEPLMEIVQHKGDSECINGLTTFAGAPDELCDFEKVRAPPYEDCGSGTGAGGFLNSGCTAATDFARGALKAGLVEEARLGANPYRLGFVGSTDTHNGTPGWVEEGGFRGHSGSLDDTPETSLAGDANGLLTIRNNPGAIVGVWAEENARDALFDALQRRETFATSGPRLQVRFFGGWSYPAELCGQPDLVQQGYAGGVPMGGVLPPAASSSPRFVVSALADSASAPLQRAQIVKGWLDADGQPREQVFEVAGDAHNGATVDTATCATSGAGLASLCAVWTDPAFDPAQRAFYYARVVENPTCRWSTRMCNTLSPERRAALHCDNLGVPKTIQERAWASPIWYAP